MRAHTALLPPAEAETTASTDLANRAARSCSRLLAFENLADANA